MKLYVLPLAVNFAFAIAVSGQITLDTKPLDRTATPAKTAAPTPQPMSTPSTQAENVSTESKNATTPLPSPTGFSDSDAAKPMPAQKPIPDTPQPDRWHGLVIDESTPDDAVRILGQPKKDESGQPLHVYGNVAHWLTKRQKEKLFRVMDFDLGKTGVQRATLYFLEAKLVRINLDLKSGTVSPNGITNIYGVRFYPMVSQIDLATFNRHSNVKTYPAVYDLVGTCEKTFVRAMVSNVPSVFGAFAKSMGIPDAEASFPGKVEFVDIISRQLENMDGADVLK